MAEFQGGAPRDGAPVAHVVPAGADRFDEHRGLGVSTIQFKVAGSESPGLLVLENTFHAKGGPARHLHVAQDEWFYVVEGEFVLEIGSERRRLAPGDSVLAPRQVPHVWAHGTTKRFILAALAVALPVARWAGRGEAFTDVGPGVQATADGSLTPKPCP
jgi:quercetin dioxygenase-like cupin family protein